MRALLLMVVMQLGAGGFAVENVCLPAAFTRNTWVVIEYSPAGRAIEGGEVRYVVPRSGYVKVPFQSPFVRSKVLVKIGDAPAFDATSSPDVHGLRRQSRERVTTDGEQTIERDFTIFFYGDEQGIVDAWSDHIPK